MIKENDIFLSYPVTIINGAMGNDFKVQGEGNKLDVQPHEEVTIVFFTLNVGINQSKLVMEEPDIMMQGYLDKMEASHFFTLGSSLN